MIKKILSVLTGAFIYFCVATVVSAVAVGITLGVKGALNEDRLYRVLAALHGVDVITLHQQLQDEQEAVDAEQPSFEEQQEAHLLDSLDLDLREKAVENGISDLTSIQGKLQTEKERFSELTKTYDKRLLEIEEQEKSNALRELLMTLEAMKPKQAKDQLIKMLEDDALPEVVSVLKQMAMDKRKKVLAEFEDGQDAEQLFEILKNIREGEPLASEIEQARENLEPFMSKAPPTTP